MNQKEILQKIGLGSYEADVYLALIEHGPSTVSEIGRYSGLHRPAIYKVLPSLQQKGLISISPKGKRQRYIAETPERLSQLFEALKAKVDPAIKELTQLHQTQGTRPLVKFVEGRRGLAQVMEDLVNSLKRGDIYCRFTAAQNYNVLEKYLPPDYKAKRDKKQLQRFVITSEDIKRSTKSALDRAIKAVPHGSALFDQNINQIIFGNKVAFMDYNSETALVIENKAIADFQREVFKLLYAKL